MVKADLARSLKPEVPMRDDYDGSYGETRKRALAKEMKRVDDLHREDDCEKERKAKADLAHNAEINRQCAEQSWQRVERRERAKPETRSSNEPSSGSFFKGPGPRGPPRRD